MRRVAGEKQGAEAHRLAYKAAHRDDALLKNLAFLQRPAVVRRKSRAEFSPDAIVRPVVDRIVGIALKIESLNVARSRADERKTAFVVRVNQLRRIRRRLHENAEPSEWVRARVFVP